MKRSNETGAGLGPLEPMETSNETGAGFGPLEPMEGSNQTGAKHGPVGRMEGQTKLAQNMVRWEEWRAKPSWRGACSVGADERVKPSWRRAWSVGPMEGSNESCRTASSVGTDGRVGRPAPWLWPVVGRSDPLRVPRI